MDNPNRRPPPFFIADDLAIDFLNSRATPGGQDVEWLAEGSDLAAWIEAAKALKPGEATRLQRQTQASALDHVAREARMLREQFRAIVDEASGRRRPVITEAIAKTLNEILYTDTLHWRLDREDPPSLRLHRQIHSPAGLLIPIAEAMGRLLSDADFTRIRRCEGAGCTLRFLDTSKNGGRRWCSMAGCGNRAKAAQHRAKLRAQTI